VVTSEPVSGFSSFTWFGPIVGPLGTAGLVLAMVIFMLLERRDLRDRLLGLFGHGRLAMTTKAFDEAGTRVSRQLLMQSLVYDALLLPALNYVERDRLEERLSADEETAVVDAIRELLCDAAESIRRVSPQPSAPPDDPRLPGPREPLHVLGCAINGIADELALGMLVHLVDDLPIAVDITGARMQASELVPLVQAREFSVVCFADLPPSPPSKTRYLVKRLRAALPEVRILVGRWAPPALADESTQLLRESGANHVGSTLAETREYLGGLVDIPRIPVSGTIGVRSSLAIVT
jgi:hypothetical protein